jgi:hypothetical protein
MDGGKNKYHYGHPDLIGKGKYSNDSVQHSHDGIEIKASRFKKGWQGYNRPDHFISVNKAFNSPISADSIPSGRGFICFLIL